MARDSLRGFLQLGLFILVAAMCSAAYAAPQSGEFVVSLCSGVLGLLLIVGAVFVSRLLR